LEGVVVSDTDKEGDREDVGKLVGVVDTETDEEGETEREDVGKLVGVVDTETDEEGNVEGVLDADAATDAEAVAVTDGDGCRSS